LPRNMDGLVAAKFSCFFIKVVSLVHARFDLLAGLCWQVCSL
jgi:hypothetical protein